MNQSIQNYIDRAKSEGLSDNEIRRTLLEAGWDGKKVDDYFNSNTTPTSFQGSSSERGFFSYVPDLPIIVRITAFLALLGGVVYLVGGGLQLFITDPNRLGPHLLQMILGAFFLVLSNGLARLRKWALYLYAGNVVLNFIIAPQSSVVAVVFLFLVFLHRNKFR